MTKFAFSLAALAIIAPWPVPAAFAAAPQSAGDSADAPAWLTTGVFAWNSSPPLLAADPSAAEPEVAFKDPSVVRYDGRWHLFGTHRLVSGDVDMQYLSFDDWSEIGRAPRHRLKFQDAYHCAPQVFYYSPHKKWYLIYQAVGDWPLPGATSQTNEQPIRRMMVPAFSTTNEIDDPKSWTKPERMVVAHPADRKQPKWIDFWVICDDESAHLFFTSDDGHFWRSATPRDAFPQGWSKPELVLHDTREELFEASHTYKLRGCEQYLTIIEAIGDRRRYYKAWLADRLAGPWRPLAATKEKPFAAVGANVEQSPLWTMSISHGELLRSGHDEFLEIDPDHLEFLYQGVDDEGYQGRKYGSIPWQIGLLKMVGPPGGK